MFLERITNNTERLVVLGLAGFLSLAATAGPAAKVIQLSRLSAAPLSFKAPADESEPFTWWLPPKADRYVLPINAGVVVETSQKNMMQWLQKGSPWRLTELPAFGVVYGDRMVVVIVPWPHYAELLVEDRV